MKIEQIHKNKIKIILSLEDLNKKNINLNTFMSEPIEAQPIFLEILNVANKKLKFNLNNYEILIDEFSIPLKNLFIVIITRIQKTTQLHISKIIYPKLKLNKYIWFQFTDFENLCGFSNSLSKNKKISSSLYLLNHTYYLLFKITHLKYLLNILLIGSEFSDSILTNTFMLNKNAELIIKNSAIQICQQYFSN